jgi:hypothetical protein
MLFAFAEGNQKENSARQSGNLLHFNNFRIIAHEITKNQGSIFRNRMIILKNFARWTGNAPFTAPGPGQTRSPGSDIPIHAADGAEGIRSPHAVCRSGR